MLGLYFSGTGNSKWAAERFLQEWGCAAETCAIEDAQAAGKLAAHQDVVFAYPVQYSALPKLVSEFVQTHAALWRGKRVFVIATMALFSGDGTGVLARELEKYGAMILGGLHLQMPDSIADEKVLKRTPEKNRRLVQAAGQKLSHAAGMIRAGRFPRQGLGMLSRAAGFLTQRLWFGHRTNTYSHSLKIDPATCMGCGLCAKLCPTGNIVMDGKTARSQDRCTLCYRCVNRCPQQAITLLGKGIVRQSCIEKHL